MIWFLLLWCIAWWALWYGIAFARFGDAKIIAELREQYKQLIHEHDALMHELSEYKEQNRIVKYKAQQLLQQNEDYAKIVSQLSRYHYHLQQASEKVKELNVILGVDDDPDLDRKIDAIERRTLHVWEWLWPTNGEQTLSSPQEKKFF